MSDDMNRDEITEQALKAAQQLATEMIHTLRDTAPAMHATALRLLQHEGAMIEIAFRFDALEVAHIELSARGKGGRVHEMGVVTVGSTRAH